MRNADSGENWQGRARKTSTEREKDTSMKRSPREILLSGGSTGKEKTMIRFVPFPDFHLQP